VKPRCLCFNWISRKHWIRPLPRVRLKVEIHEIQFSDVTNYRNLRNPPPPPISRNPHAKKHQCEVNHCQYLSSTVCFIREFQRGFLLATLRLVDCLTGLHIGITCEGNRRIVVVSEINNNNNNAKSNTSHEIHCNTPKANYRNPPVLDREPRFLNVVANTWL